jgi:hypothetical protein
MRQQFGYDRKQKRIDTWVPYANNLPIRHIPKDLQLPSSLAMGETSSDGSNRPIARLGSPGATPARPRSQRSQERRRALIISCGMLLAATATAVVVIALGSPISVPASNSAQTTMAMPDGDLRTARITTDSGGKGCSRQTFDNQTGRMTRSQQPCEATAYDSNGVPVPLGTIHRLDAISKSFSGH